MRRVVAAALLLAGCGGDPVPRSDADPAAALERAAIERGLVADPADDDPTGLYARDTDRICVVPAGDDYRVGIVVDYGEGVGCAGRGTAERRGEVLAITLEGEGGCRFDARLDGAWLRLPARVPAECASRCRGRASFSAAQGERLSPLRAEAEALRDPRGRTPCAEPEAS